MANIFSRFLSSIVSPIIKDSIREQLTVTEDDNTFFVGTRRYGETDRDRLEYNRQDVLEDCLTAWRDNPLARRIVELTSQYVVGSGFDIKVTPARIETQAGTPSEEQAKTFIEKFWDHRLNRMDSRIVELCDELTRTGNLFIMLSTDASGMSYIRTLPATNIDQIISAENDIEQPVSFITKAGEDMQPITYPAYSAQNDAQGEDGAFTPVVIHYAINRPAGAQWGEPDLAPLLPWLTRYSAWLQDRVRLNRFRNAFLYVVSGTFVNEDARKARQTTLAANPPSPGSILVCDESETWSVISPKLEASEAKEDGMAIKKLIASGVGIPLHFLAEPEGTNRTTAESAGGPTFRRFEQRQKFFMWLLKDLLNIVITRRAQVDKSFNPDVVLQIAGADISARDNVAHSIAAVNILNALERLKDMGLISDRELLRATYRFSGEPADVDELLSEGSGIDARESTNPLRPPGTDTIDTTTGDPKKATLQKE
jgi:hypothetical protein